MTDHHGYVATSA